MNKLFNEIGFNFSDRDLHVILANEIIKINASLDAFISFSIRQTCEEVTDTPEEIGKDIAKDIARRFNDTWAGYASRFGDKS